MLDHEQLDVYQVALEFLVFANDVVERLPRGRSHLADQLTRASTSIVLNLAEGAGKHSKPDKRRYYLTSRGSATESAALLDVCLRCGFWMKSGTALEGALDFSAGFVELLVVRELGGTTTVRRYDSVAPTCMQCFAKLIRVVRLVRE
jgi:four helix bundle protein